MKVFDIDTGIGGYQVHSVVAETMGEAERIFRAKYWPTEIIAIKLHSEYVQIQKFDEQPKNEPNIAPSIGAAGNRSAQSGPPNTQSTQAIELK